MWGPDGKCLWSEGSWGPLLCRRPVSPSQSRANAGYCLTTAPGFQSWYTAKQKEKPSHHLSGMFRLVVKPLENKHLENGDSMFFTFFKLLRVSSVHRHYGRCCTQWPFPLRRWQSIKWYKQYHVVNAKTQLCTGTTALWAQRIKLQKSIWACQRKLHRGNKKSKGWPGGTGKKDNAYRGSSICKVID